MADGIVFVPTVDAGSAQQRIDGTLIAPAATPVYRSRRLVLLCIGDSNTAAYPLREALWRRLRSFRGGIKLLGNLGMQATTGGSPGRRFIGDWRHEGHSGYRLTRSTTATVDPATGTFTAAAPGGIANHGAVAFSSTGALPGGLLANRVYFFTGVSGATFRLSATQGGAAITGYADAGTGTITVGLGLLEMWPALHPGYDEAPDIILIKAGTNDIIGGATASATLSATGALIDQMRITFPAAEIVVCSIAPLLPGTATDGSWASLAAARDAYVAGLPGLVATKGSRVGYYNTAAGLNAGNMSSDGVHPLSQGYVAEADAYGTVVERLGGASHGKPAPRAITTRAATSSVVLAANTDVVTIPYDHALSPGRDASGNQVDQSFAVGFWHYPTALPADSAVRVLVKYGTVHPAGYLIGHRATSGNGGGISVYLGASGAGVISGPTAGSYSGEVLKLNQWARVWVFFDRNKLQCGLFINGRLVLWAPIPAAWTIAEQNPTYIGRASPFSAGLGLIDGFVLAKGSHLNVDNALEYCEADYYDGILPPGVTAAYGLASGTGTAAAPITYGLPNGTLTGATWSAAGVVPKVGIDEVLP
ncbi:GDSL-type esterase/lipase family protein [Sorangium sp. So ce1000]|uniref:GDSL-type esterase/lipase family protein n=1 Tax=Sorangium sp. So ce1000 TaxID=3133325 RepID=UPI003F5F433A